MAENKDSLALVAVYDNDVAANIALGVLHANGIPAILDHELVDQVFGMQLAPADGIRLMVYQRDLDTAVQLLASQPSKGGASEE